MSNKFKPDHITTPGEHIAEWLECQDMTVELAMKLEKLTGIKVSMWLGLARDQERVRVFIRGMKG